MELTARRTLSFLSGGELVPLLGDILYPSEKELLAERFGNSDGNVAFPTFPVRYRGALDRIGEVVKGFQPREKGKVLPCQSTKNHSFCRYWEP